jgi:hypothetical protein
MPLDLGCVIKSAGVVTGRSLEADALEVGGWKGDIGAAVAAAAAFSSSSNILASSFMASNFLLCRAVLNSLRRSSCALT